jgi:hypothetical protein
MTNFTNTKIKGNYNTYLGRDSFDWQRRPIAVASPFAIPSSTPSFSAPLFAEMNRFHINNNANGNSHPAEQVSPAYSQNSLLSSSHYQLSSNPLGAQHEHFNPALINGIVVLWREFN